MDTATSELEELFNQLQATEQLPIDRTANRWLGEAQAITKDLVRGDPDPETIHRRVEKVLELLDEIDGTGSQEGDDRVAAARSVAEGLLQAHQPE